MKDTDGEFYANKLMDLANLGVAMLVFSQLVSEHPNWIPIGYGCSFFCVFTMLCYLLRTGGK